MRIKELTIYKIVASIAILIASFSLATTMAKADSIPATVDTKDVIVNVYCGECCNPTPTEVKPVEVKPVVAKPIVNTNTNTNTVIINNQVTSPAPLEPAIVIVDKSKVHIHNNIHPKFDVKVNNHNKK